MATTRSSSDSHRCRTTQDAKLRRMTWKTKPGEAIPTAAGYAATWQGALGGLAVGRGSGGGKYPPPGNQMLTVGVCTGFHEEVLALIEESGRLLHRQKHNTAIKKRTR